MEEILSQPLAMVNETNIKQYVNKYAIIHGKVSSVKNNNLFLTINPETNVDLIVKNFSQQVRVGSIVKIIGKVYQDSSVEFLDLYNLSDEFDLKLANEMIPVIHHREVENMFS